MNDINVEKQMKTIQKHLKSWAEKAQQDYPSHLEHSVRQAVNKLDVAGLAKASEDVVGTVTGNRKTARKARKVVEESLRRAQKKAGTQKSSGRAWVILSSVAVIGLITVLVLRRRDEPTPSSPAPATPTPGSTENAVKGVDPDLGK